MLLSSVFSITMSRLHFPHAASHGFSSQGISKVCKGLIQVPCSNSTVATPLLLPFLFFLSLSLSQGWNVKVLNLLSIHWIGVERMLEIRTCCFHDHVDSLLKPVLTLDLSSSAVSPCRARLCQWLPTPRAHKNLKPSLAHLLFKSKTQ